MQLSDAQLKAVEYIAGPQVILAGAGSGKTRVIVAKAQYLIEQKNYSPDSILAITYSNKTQAELEERMAQLGDDIPEIKTFHSFGMEIIGEFGNLLHLNGEPQKHSDYKLRQYLQLAIADLKTSTLLDTNKPDKTYRDLAKFISRAKDELVGPDEVIARAEKELSSISNSDNDENLINRDRWTKILEAGKIYKAYELIKPQNNLKSQMGGLDYGDMIALSYQLLKNHKIVGATLRQRFRYILVDEFQDTNYAQVEILHLLAGDKCGITVVGDDDQAIYRFRGASFASFRLFQKLFPGMIIFKLEENYRSSSSIVRAAQSLIESDPAARFDSSKKMIAASQSGEKVIIRKCPDYFSEAESAADEIQRLLLRDEYRKPSSIAVLVRARYHKDILAAELKNRGIDFYCDSNTSGKLTKPAQLLRAIYEFTVDDGRKDYLALIVRHFMPNITLTLERDIGYRLSRETGDSLGILAAIAFELEQSQADSLNNIIELLKNFREMKQERDPLQLLERIAVRAGIFQSIITNGKVTDHQAATEISSLLKAAEQFHAEEESLTHGAFLEYLSWKEGTDNNGGTESEIVSSVILQTIHASKGLEYPVVFMIGLSNRRFPPQKRSDEIEFPHELYKDETPGDDFRIQEERRLFYVGMTRAKQLLYLYGIEKKGSKISQFVTTLEKSEIFDEVSTIEPVAQSEVQVIEHIKPESALEDQTKSIIIGVNDSLEPGLSVGLFRLWKIRAANAKTADEFQNIKNDFKENFSAVFTAFNTAIVGDVFVPPILETRYKVGRIAYTDLESFQKCPLQFYFRKALNLPTPSTSAQHFGQVMHKILETAGQQLINKKTPTREELLADFEQQWRTVHFDDPDHKERLKLRAGELIDRFIKMQSARTGTPLELEKRFSIGLGDVQLIGMIDRVDKTSDGLEIIDYKTGKQSSIDLKKDLQLPIYALACHAEFGEYPKRLLYMFLGDDTVAELSFTGEQLDKIKTDIIVEIEKINCSDFAATPEMRTCQQCNYNAICPASQA